MAQWIKTKRQAELKKSAENTKDGFNNMGKPVPEFRKQVAYDHCKAMGMQDSAKITTVIGAMSEALERDAPYQAMEAGMTYLDLIGTYRLMAVLLVAPKPVNNYGFPELI